MAKKEGSRYYVEYLGWKETTGIYGSEFVSPVVQELLFRRKNGQRLPKMTIKISQEEIRISQQNQQGGNSQKIRYPSIPIEDTSFVLQGAAPYNDIVACIFLGYNPHTKCAAHVHAYRFDSKDTAAMFEHQLSSIISKPQYKQRILAIEHDLCELGHVKLRSDHNGNRVTTQGSDGYSYGTSSPDLSISSDGGGSPKFLSRMESLAQRTDIKIAKSSNPTQQPDKIKGYENVFQEFHNKLKVQDSQLLLPPKDYDTIVRRHGHLSIRGKLAAPRKSISGPDSIFNPHNQQQVPSSNSYPQLRKQSLPVLTRLQYSEQTSRSKDPPYSMTSSESSYTDDMYGIYKGYNPSLFSRHSSKVSEDASSMVMWSTEYSFGHQEAGANFGRVAGDHSQIKTSSSQGVLRRK